MYSVQCTQIEKLSSHKLELQVKMYDMARIYLQGLKMVYKLNNFLLNVFMSAKELCYVDRRTV